MTYVAMFWEVLAFILVVTGIFVVARKKPTVGASIVLAIVVLATIIKTVQFGNVENAFGGAFLIASLPVQVGFAVYCIALAVKDQVRLWKLIHGRS